MYVAFLVLFSCLVAFPTRRLEDPEVKDLDFMHADDHAAQLIASVGGDGSCIIWQLDLQQQQGRQPQAQQITQLEPPSRKHNMGF